ncbi:MAG TPA: tRNA (5-methylaminomethyl-2-thiouridine)(34)-methyltransferase MnmD [Caulobacteraceae bacterium]|jgi:tRNA 5-methylaminomethyl-2-thiouridine biosynthesis bifunctional protein|nr:tRNA (5-methylaminomethyl-2-thiouridine)(34)-methyltransferase MnmD [Caulobacteraceae bacterium]
MADPIRTVADWSRGLPPRSRDHGDVYFSADDGLAEARAVFLEGCGLPAAWRGRERFCVGELGFGASLNIAALVDLWRAQPPPGGSLHVFTVEREPLSAEEAALALSQWPRLAETAARMTGAWPSARPGLHRMAFDDWRVTIDVAVMEAGPALEHWPGRADAWFLDGFSPALDPQLWRDEVLQLIAARSAPGARVATYTVAGAVRRGLAQAGFDLQRRPGHGRKRERLEGILRSGSQGAAAAGPVAVIGAGIAGAAAAVALRTLGWEARVFDAAARGAGASGGPLALSAPRLDAGLGAIARLFGEAAAFAAGSYDGVAGAVAGTDALQLARGPRDEARFAAIAGSDLFDPAALILSAQETAARVGERSPMALRLPYARVIRPAVVLAAWLSSVEHARITRIEHLQSGWRLTTDEGQTHGPFSAVIVAAGAQSVGLLPTLPISPVRGQVSIADGVAFPLACSGEAYVLPLDRGVLFGATYDRGQSDDAPRAEDDRRNLASIARTLPELAARLRPATLRSWTAIRAATADNLPLAGPAVDGPPGVFVLSGLGSRGFVLAPLLGAHLAALIASAPSPLPLDFAALVDPARFAARAARRNERR